MTDSPQIFENLVALQRHTSDQLINYRCIEAEAMRVLAVEYELKALNEPDSTERAWYEGIAAGLHIAAARLDVSVKVEA